MHVGLVDGRNGGVRVGVGGEKDATGLGVEVAGLLEELDAGHSGHPLIGEQQPDLLVPELQLLEGVQGGRAGLGPADAVVLAVLLAQVAGQATATPQGRRRR